MWTIARRAVLVRGGSSLQHLLAPSKSGSGCESANTNAERNPTRTSSGSSPSSPRLIGIGARTTSPFSPLRTQRPSLSDVRNPATRVASIPRSWHAANRRTSTAPALLAAAARNRAHGARRARPPTARASSWPSRPPRCRARPARACAAHPRTHGRVRTSGGRAPQARASTDSCCLRRSREPAAETQRLSRSQSGGRERAGPRRSRRSPAWEAELSRQRDTARAMCKENIDLVLDRSAHLAQERSMSRRSSGTRTLG
jgi:hypothetical protein